MSTEKIKLPDPKVEIVTTDDSKEHLVISREGGRARSYEIGGGTTNERIKATIEKVISDRFTHEWLP